MHPIIRRFAPILVLFSVTSVTVPTLRNQKKRIAKDRIAGMFKLCKKRPVEATTAWFDGFCAAIYT